MNFTLPIFFTKYKETSHFWIYFFNITNERDSMKLFFIVATCMTLACQASFAEDALIDRNMALKTKEVTLFSQMLIDGQTLPIEVEMYGSGDRGIFGRLKGEPEITWVSPINISVKDINCLNGDSFKPLENNGYVLKSRISDSLISGMRDGVEVLKKNGAKYVFLSKWLYKLKEPERKNIIYMNENFHDVFTRLMDEEYARKDQGKDRNEKGLTVHFDNLPSTCSDPQGFSMKSALSVAGTLAAMAVGVSGASAGNVNMTSLAAHSGTAMQNTLSLSKDAQELSKDTSIITSRLSFGIQGTVDPDYFKNNQSKGAAYQVYGFPIEEVEAELARYMPIPHQTKAKIR